MRKMGRRKERERKIREEIDRGPDEEDGEKEREGEEDTGRNR